MIRSAYDRRGYFDLIPVVLQMPGANGPETTREIRRQNASRGMGNLILACPRTPIVLFKQDALDAGVELGLPKPLEKRLSLYSH